MDSFNIKVTDDTLLYEDNKGQKNTINVEFTGINQLIRTLKENNDSNDFTDKGISFDFCLKPSLDKIGEYVNTNTCKNSTINTESNSINNVNELKTFLDKMLDNPVDRFFIDKFFGKKDSENTQSNQQQSVKPDWLNLFKQLPVIFGNVIKPDNIANEHAEMLVKKDENELDKNENEEMNKDENELNKNEKDETNNKDEYQQTTEEESRTNIVNDILSGFGMDPRETREKASKQRKEDLEMIKNGLLGIFSLFSPSSEHYSEAEKGINNLYGLNSDSEVKDSCESKSGSSSGTETEVKVEDEMKNEDKAETETEMKNEDKSETENETEVKPEIENKPEEDLTSHAIDGILSALKSYHSIRPENVKREKNEENIFEYISRVFGENKITDEDRKDARNGAFVTEPLLNVLCGICKDSKELKKMRDTFYDLCKEEKNEKEETLNQDINLNQDITQDTTQNKKTPEFVKRRLMEELKSKVKIRSEDSDSDEDNTDDEVEEFMAI